MFIVHSEKVGIARLVNDIPVDNGSATQHNIGLSVVLSKCRITCKSHKIRPLQHYCHRHRRLSISRSLVCVTNTAFGLQRSHVWHCRILLLHPRAIDSLIYGSAASYLVTPLHPPSFLRSRSAVTWTASLSCHRRTARRCAVL